jgi:hypothetical protein
MRQGRGLDTRPALAALLAGVCALAAVGSAGASSSRAGLSFPLAQARVMMRQYFPGTYMPTKLPAKIAWLEVGGGCATLGPGAPPCFVRASYQTRQTGGKVAFLAAFYAGRQKAKIIRALRVHDGAAGTLTAFTAGKYAGSRERQWDKRYSAGGVDTYVWEYRTKTYLIQYHFSNAGVIDYPGFLPKTVIASYAPA